MTRRSSNFRISCYVNESNKPQITSFCLFNRILLNSGSVDFSEQFNNNKRGSTKHTNHRNSETNEDLGVRETGRGDQFLCL